MAARTQLLVTLSLGMTMIAGGVVAMALRRPAEEPSPPPTLELPAAPVGYGAARPVWTVALWIDFTTPTSRQAYSQVTRAVREGLLFEGAAELRLLHAPSGGCEGEARSQFKCAAARVIECAEKMSPGTGVHLAGELFDLQWDPSTRGEIAAVLGAGTMRGLDAGALGRCVEEDVEIAGRVRAHGRFAADRGLAEAPGGFVLRVDAAEKVAPFGVDVTAEMLRALSVVMVDGRREEAG